MRVSFLVKIPAEPLIRKIRTARMIVATTTVMPTLSCDHLSCCWLGTLFPVGEQKMITETHPGVPITTDWLLDGEGFSGQCSYRICHSRTYQRSRQSKMDGDHHGAY